MGVASHLLYQAVHEGRARLLRGCTPLSFGMDDPSSPPSPPHTYMPCTGSECCSGGPLVTISGFRGSPPPLHAVRWERTLLGGCPLLVPLLPLGHVVRWERILPFRRIPLAILVRPARCGHTRSGPCPFLPARGLRALLGLGGPPPRPLWSGPGCAGESCAGIIGGPPCAPAARRGLALLDGSSPSPFPPSAATHVRHA